MFTLKWTGKWQNGVCVLHENVAIIHFLCFVCSGVHGMMFAFDGLHFRACVSSFPWPKRLFLLTHRQHHEWIDWTQSIRCHMRQCLTLTLYATKLPHFQTNHICTCFVWLTPSHVGKQIYKKKMCKLINCSFYHLTFHSYSKVSASFRFIRAEWKTLWKLMGNNINFNEFFFKSNIRLTCLCRSVWNIKWCISQRNSFITRFEKKEKGFRLGFKNSLASTITMAQNFINLIIRLFDLNEFDDVSCVRFFILLLTYILCSRKHFTFSKLQFCSSLNLISLVDFGV